jgi:hypothetical protein
VNDMLSETLEQAELKRPVSQNLLHLFPLVSGTTSAEEGVRLLDEALEGETLRVEELDESGSVLELRVTNGGAMSVLILEGDELIGAKQNRVVNSSVLVAAASELVLPVSCVERGRWSCRSPAFSSGHGTPHLSLRHLKSRSVHDSLRRGRGHRSDQDAVWEEVDRLAYLHNSPSPTDALQDTRTGLSEKLAAFDTLLEKIPEGTCGVVVAIGERPVALEILAGPRSFARVLPKRLAGYALEALEHEGDSALSDFSTIERFVADVAAARRESHSGRALRTRERRAPEGVEARSSTRRDLPGGY